MTWSIAPVLPCADVRRSAEWFRDALAFTVTGLFEPPGDDGAVYAIVERDGIGIHLQIRRGPAPAPRDAIDTDVYVTVDDADALFERCRAAGVTIHRPIEDEPYGMRDFAIETPDGHRIAFGAPISGA